MQFHVAAKLQWQSHLKCHVEKMFDTTHYTQTWENSFLLTIAKLVNF